jgi:hypothetical protein
MFIRCHSSYDYPNLFKWDEREHGFRCIVFYGFPGNPSRSWRFF